MIKRQQYVEMSKCYKSHKTVLMYLLEKVKQELSSGAFKFIIISLTNCDMKRNRYMISEGSQIIPSK